MKVHDLKPSPGSTRPRRRVGRGIAGKGGKTAGRGTKGQGARDNIKPGFEGGQLPLKQRIPKLKGFKNPFRVAYTPVNIGALASLKADEITVQTMVEAGLCRPKDLVKVLGQGVLDRPIRVTAHAFSASAAAAISTAGGSVERMPLPFGNGRPPASGNALMNR
jgi:large subunit ribosomal protein L15